MIIDTILDYNHLIYLISYKSFYKSQNIYMVPLDIFDKLFEMRIKPYFYCKYV